MRPTPVSPACAVLLLCLLSLGCNGGSPFTSGGGSKVTTPPVPTPVTSPITVSTGPTAPVSVMISDPAACKAPNGPLSHVYITVADVMASTNPDAPAGDSSFVDLTPGLSAAPQQVDLMGKADSRCFLAALSVSKLVAAGSYQQIRIFLAPDSAASKVANNACGASYANCVVRTDNSLYDLQLTAAAANGFEVPAARLADGGIGIDAGDTPTMDIDFDICSSILLTANGGYEFNPVVHAGLIPSTGSSISGTVVSSATGQPLAGGHIIVALEQKDATTGIDRILMRTAASSTGTFTLCPVPTGTYDLVAVGVDGANVSYSAGVETGIQSGQLAGEIPLVPGSGEGTLQGWVTTQGGGLQLAGLPVAVQTDALEQLPGTGSTITVPLLPTYSPYNAAMLTASGSSCPAGADCAAYALQLPTSAPNVVACSDQTAQFKQQGDPTPDYAAETWAEVAGSGDTADCAQPTMQGSSIALNPDQSATAATLAFTQCE